MRTRRSDAPACGLRPSAGQAGFLRLALALLLATACAAANGGNCHVEGDCASDTCCLTCGIGPCGANNVGICCAGTCGVDGGCPAGSTCDAGICI